MTEKSTVDRIHEHLTVLTWVVLIGFLLIAWAAVR